MKPQPRIGNVAYLNAAPLTRGLESEVLFATPAELARRLGRGELDAALVSITEALLLDRYDVLDGVAIASRGEVKSVLLAHRGPLAEIREVWCDPASLTSVNLLRVLLGERGLRPAFRALPDYARVPQCDAVLLIGDPALDHLFAHGPEHRILDLGADWWALTGLPFVFAAWVLRRGVALEDVRAKLRAAHARGVAELEQIARERTEYDYAFRRAYLGGNIRYDLGPEEKRGIARFGELLCRHGGTPVHAPRFVD